MIYEIFSAINGVIIKSEPDNFSLIDLMEEAFPFINNDQMCPWCLVCHGGYENAIYIPH
jgi:hypothetical protein